MLDVESIRFLNMRDQLYDIFIYHLDVTDCVWFILEYLITQKHLQQDDVTETLERTFVFLQYYNNNYRPIYHLESFIFYLIRKIHGLS